MKSVAQAAVIVLAAFDLIPASKGFDPVAPPAWALPKNQGVSPS